jgi:multiple sugar transport system substrate-binding protein
VAEVVMRRAGSAAALLLMAAIVVGCTSGAEEAPTRVTVMVSGDPAEIEAYRAVVTGFSDSQDDVEADLLPFAGRDDLIARLSTSIAGGQPPDLFLMNYRYYGQFAARDALEPVGPYLEGSAAFAEDDFFATAMTPFRWDGEQMCLPQNVSSLVVYYNADLFRSAGVDTPSAGWTWDDMVAAADRLTSDEDGDGTADVYGLGVDPEIIRVAPLIWSNGGTLVDDDVSPTRFDFDPPAIEAIQRFFTLRTAEVTPTDEEAEAEDFETRFLNGRLAMLMESRRVVPTLRTITDFEWDVASLPPMDVPVSVLHSDAYCITAGSDAKDAAWRFLEFALGPEGQRIAAGSGRTVPSLRSVAESDAFLDPEADPAHSQVFLEQIPTLRAVPVISTWPEIEDTANALLEEGYYGGGRALEVSLEITAATRDAFARAED